MRKLLGNLLRWSIALGLLYYLFRYRVDLAEFRETVDGVHRGWLTAAVLSFAVPFACGVWRWRLLLHSQDIRLSWRRVTAICFVGQFFNAFMLGGTGGDLVKAYYTTRQTATHKPEAALSVLVDRLLGLLGLCSVMLVMIVAQLPTLRAQPALRWPAVAASAIVLSAFVLIAASLSSAWRRHLGRLGQRLQHLPLYPSVARAASSYHRYTEHKRVLGQAYALSVVAHVGGLLSAILLGRALGIAGVSWDRYFLVVPLINTIASLPVTVAGFGVREELYRQTLGAFGVAAAPAVALGLLNYGTQLVWSLVGGVVYFGWRHEPHLLQHALQQSDAAGQARPQSDAARPAPQRPAVE